MDEAKVREILGKMLRKKANELERRTKTAPRHLPPANNTGTERFQARDFLVMSEWVRNSLLGLEDLSELEIMKIIETAESFAHQEPRQSSEKGHLSGYRIINLFMEPSTRTRVAFEIAAKSLGADVISISGEASSLTKGKASKIRHLNVKALGADAIVIRHSSPGSPLLLSRIVTYLLLMREMGHMNTQSGPSRYIYLKAKAGEIKRKNNYTWRHSISRVARSNLWINNAWGKGNLGRPINIGSKRICTNGCKGPTT